MKLWTLTTLCTASLLILSGCGASPKPKEQAIVDASLPVVELTKNGVFADVNAIAFEWKRIIDPRVEGIYVFKKSPNDEGGVKEHTYYDTIENRFATHYVDNRINANSKYSYAFKTFSKNAESRLTNTIYVQSLPMIESVSWIHSINGMPRTAKIIWRPHSNQKVKSYIIERKTDKVKGFVEIARVNGRLNVEYIDTKLDDNKIYEYRVKVLTFDGLESVASRSVSVVTKALPNSVQNLNASFDFPKEIHLKWKQTTNKDFAIYHVYRSEHVDGEYELIAKRYKNTHIDKVDEDDKSYFYRVSVLDKDGLESNSKSTTVGGATLEKPKFPTSLKARYLGSKVELTWSNSDKRTKKYIITKNEKSGWLSEENYKYTVHGSLHYMDTKVKAGRTYIYQVYAVDANAIVSEPSAKVEVKIPESNKLIAPKKVTLKQESIASPVPSVEVEGETIIPNKDLILNEI